ncbi:MAG TPA: carboxypeptidase-like regulatory domain-containing protein, partial [Chitinophagaceae bacterium]|nr:carboxypeptidase-like regulatory domain-containing protein [Chitinophagaceae bacterium]
MKAIFNRFTFIALLLCLGKAQAQTGISGHVEAAGKPLPLVSVALLQDSSFVSGGISDDTGNFHLVIPAAKHTSYTLRLSLVGYQPFSKKFTWPDTAFMTRLVLTEKTRTLNEVTVTAKKPLVTRKADRYIVNVEDSYLANGNSGLDVLQKSPGLWVSPDGSIRIKGTQPVTVMINDVVQRMSATELADYLRTLRSEDISKIEIIPNPPSEYEASSAGGIVHIVLKKARKDGLTGSLYTQYKQQVERPYAVAGASSDFKLRKFYLFGSFFSNLDRSAYTGHTNVTYPDGSTLYTSGHRYNNNTRYQYRFGMAYDFSATQSINIQTTGSKNILLQRFLSDIGYQLPGKLSTGT